MSQYEVSSEPVVGTQGKLDIDFCAGGEFAESGFGECFAANIEGRRCAGLFRDGQAGAVYSDAVACFGLISQLAEVDGQRSGTAASGERLYRADLLYYSCEHSN